MANYASDTPEPGAANSDDLAHRLVTLHDPNGRGSEAYRAIRTNLLYSAANAHPQVVLVTSAGPQEGKSTTCANLAVTLAQTGKSTLLVDCDLRRPLIHRLFELRNIRGIVNVLVAENALEEVCQEPLQNLKVVTVGPIPPNPTELLDSQPMTDFLRHARKEFDYVLIDTSPVGPVADPLVLAMQCDGVLLVLDAQKTRKAAARHSIGSIQSLGAPVLGTVLNNFKVRGDDYYGYYTDYSATSS